ncbi:hypothetical protein DMH17_13645 [Raoultella planticola]|nr:hypothetical protein [Raoultella planticola]
MYQAIDAKANTGNAVGIDTRNPGLPDKESPDTAPASRRSILRLPHDLREYRCGPGRWACHRRYPPGLPRAAASRRYLPPAPGEESVFPMIVPLELRVGG